ncbi:hypothetical protein CH333_08310 [candidate division WOR-3 bacterium JGI_Cruoil_03_44_89]|uniref:Transposase IS200-like domain-containing protein n=1 Tax=candidate division WOR-3 bacterium JGI_Cruoil_03_44_89 TaxID=1973748 RepID=A0A235BRI8_UNCW3|nr:MAG: hypothetical protein CH333_08310 [candidate division WOR-3 bacterium JGI_Cruoil_03_44_89]
MEISDKIYSETAEFESGVLISSKIIERYDFFIYAYTLMSNHIHLLVEAGDTPLSKIMQGFLQSCTQYYNRKYKIVGHLFQSRYKAILCDKDVYLLQLLRYIHMNPVRAKIVESPSDYLWSSHRVLNKMLLMR